MAKEPRYWVYVHDQDGELADDLGDAVDLPEAFALVVEWMTDSPSDYLETYTIRIVDNEADHTTVWSAGPVGRSADGQETG